MDSQQASVNPSQQDDQASNPPSIGDSLAANSTSQPVSENQNFTEIALPEGAEDTHLIEEEWVERAKEIVELTKNDPYEQQRALSQMKADYMKKRYDKDIKLSES